MQQLLQSKGIDIIINFSGFNEDHLKERASQQSFINQQIEKQNERRNTIIRVFEKDLTCIIFSNLFQQ
jgi:hypothetical protein